MMFSFIRHGETIENSQGITQGQKYGTLSKLGLQQARDVAQNLKGDQFAAIYTSDLDRAKKTAEIIAARHKETPFLIDSRLREYSFGKYEGQKSNTWRWADQPGFDDITKHVEDGESAIDVSRRVASFINDALIRFTPDDKVLIVTHGGPMRIVISLVKQVPLTDVWDQYEIPNTKIIELQIDGQVPSQLK